MNHVLSPPPGGADEVYDGITSLLQKVGCGGSDAVMAACAACLEAALSIASVAVGKQETASGCREALHAANAASLAIRFALVEHADSRRTGRSTAS